MGDSEKLIIGEWAVAFGNPFGLFDVNQQPTATVGIVSGKDLDFGVQSGKVFQDMIQTDAAINPGNSGGPLINLSGKVIGINTFIITESKGSGGIGFSIPINRFKENLEDLKQFGKIDRNWIHGITVRELNDRYKKYLKLDVNSGVIVSDVEKKSAAAVAGILIRDIIYKVNGKSVNSAEEIEEILDEGYFKTGDEVEIIIIRNNNSTKVKLKLIDPHEK
jgi:serine protease Do